MLSMHKLILLCVILHIVQATHFVRVALSTPVTIENGPFTIPFDNVKLELGDKYDKSTDKVVVSKSGKYYVESHVEVESEYPPVVEIVKESDGNQSVAASCNKLENNKCKFAERVVLVNGDKIYVRVNAHANSNTTVLKSDTYLYVASM